MPEWTAEQVLALAPDAASAKNGQGLATRSKWSSLGRTQFAIWGECQGSGKNPYQAQIDLSEPAFRCSCPSRKFPCKHGLGLFLLLTEQPEAIAISEPPDWVAKWLATRSQRAEKQTEKRTQPEVVDPAAQAKRAAERQRKVSAGVRELRLWLEDRVRQGLATVPQESYQVWDAIAARMVDAQAPGLARHLRELAGVAHTGTGWIDRLLERLGRLYLITQAFERIETLPPEVQADLHTQIGWPVSQEELAGAVQHDLWLVVGQRTEIEDRLKVRRTWLLGLSSATPALLLDFAHGDQSFEQSFLAGTCLEAELVFHPSAYPLRASLKARHEAALLAKTPPGHETIAAAITTYSKAFAACPWLERFPLLLQNVTPMRKGGWLLQDHEGTVLPLLIRLESYGWRLLALGGGYPLAVFGEWDGTQLLPLSVWAEDTFYGLG